MERPTISTATGDEGHTSLYGGKRVSKASKRIQAYGDVDELNAILGLVLAEEGVPEAIRTQLREIQRTLFIIGSDLATPISTEVNVPRATEQHITQLEQWGQRLEEVLPELHHFVLPSGSRPGCLLHLARTVCRRAERWIVAFAMEKQVNTHAKVYINRLSDYLFIAARVVNMHLKQAEVEWIPE